MIKYAKIEGYKNLGEVQSHIYQWIAEEPDKEGNRVIILIKAYSVSPPMIFKGIVLGYSNSYKPINITEDLKEVESLIGITELSVLKDIDDSFNTFTLID